MWQVEGIPFQRRRRRAHTWNKKEAGLNKDGYSIAPSHIPYETHATTNNATAWTRQPPAEGVALGGCRAAREGSARSRPRPEIWRGRGTELGAHPSCPHPHPHPHPLTGPASTTTIKTMSASSSNSRAAPPSERYARLLHPSFHLLPVINPHAAPLPLLLVQCHHQPPSSTQPTAASGHPPAVHRVRGARPPQGLAPRTPPGRGVAGQGQGALQGSVANQGHGESDRGRARGRNHATRTRYVRGICWVGGCWWWSDAACTHIHTQPRCRTT